MTSKLFFLPGILLTVHLACSNTPSSTNRGGIINEANQQSELQSERTSLNAPVTSNGEYTVFDRVRVIDKMGFDEPAYAYSILLPRGWKHQGNISWIFQTQTQYGNGTYNEFAAESPDGKYSFRMLPEFLWMWNSDPQLIDMMRMDIQQVKNVTVAEPMGAEQYLRNMFVRQELQGATIDAVKPAPDVIKEMQHQLGNKLNELRQYGASDVQFYPTAIRADVHFSDGIAGIVLAGVSVLETTIMNQYNGQMQKSFTSVATKRMIFRFPADEKENAEEILAVMLGSMRINPVWKEAVDKFWTDARQRSHVVHVGKIQIMDAQTRAIGDATIQQGAQNLKNMDTQQKMWEQGQASQDRMHTGFIKTIREVETYSDATGIIELSSGFDHAWSRSDGSSFILSNSPNFDPSSVFQDQRWEEMKVVK